MKLDREVEDQEVAMLSKDEIAHDQPVYVMGHPVGLPLKYAPGARVLGIEEALFAADLDTYMGSSGSPVFNADTHEVIGIVVHDDAMDFRWMGRGWGSIIYPHRDIYSKGPQCTKVSQFKYIFDKNRKIFDPVVKQLNGWIHSLELPQRWRTDGIAPPNYDSKKSAQKVAEALYKDFSLIPIRITVSIEEGIYLKYKNFDNDKVLEIEVYNDKLDIAAILTRNDEIIKSADIEKEDFSEIVKLFNEE